MLTALVSGLLVGVTAPGAVAVPDRDCGDFDTQAAAQRFYLDQGGPKSDPHRLDADGDGVACESNPCPCSTDQGGGSQDGGGQDGAGQSGPKGGKKNPVINQRGRITRVIDGDTVDVRLNRNKAIVRVRLIGIDSPERAQGCRYRAATRAAERLLPVHKSVVLRSDPSQDRVDRYGRVLRYVLKGKTDVNRAMVRKGQARVYVYDNTPFRRVASYRKMQKQAQRNDRGVWGPCSR
ncbi:hypothetical protein GCM10027020_21520 [Nocardioides salsibiostraticola]